MWIACAASTVPRPGQTSRSRARRAAAWTVGRTRQYGGMSVRSPAAPDLAGFSEATQGLVRRLPSPRRPRPRRRRGTSIGRGQHTLVIAPTGSGKTLAAFLWAIDQLAREPVPADPKQRCRVLYVSPMKALAVDVERNLRSPLTGIGHAARRLGLPEPDIRVGGPDRGHRGRRAPQDGGQAAGHPDHHPRVAVPAARPRGPGRRCAACETVIIDEVHAMAGGKRGAHLALSLERLDALRAQATARRRPGASASGCRRRCGRPRRWPRSWAGRCRSASSPRPARSS